MSDEQTTFDAIAVGEMLDKAHTNGCITAVVLAFGKYRAIGYITSAAACYALRDCELES